MEQHVATASASIDLSQLLTFNVGFKNLELVLQTVLTRLDRVEHNLDQHVNHDDKRFAAVNERDNQLDEKLNALSAGLKEQQDKLEKHVETNSHRLDAIDKELAALKRELARLDDDAHAQVQRVADLQNDVDALKRGPANEEVAVVQKAVKPVQKSPPAAHVAPPQAVVSLAAQSARDFSSEIEDLKKKVQALDDNKADRRPVEARIDAIQESVEESQKRVDDTLTEVKAHLQELDDRCFTQENETKKVDALSQGRDDDLAKRFADLEEELKAKLAAVPQQQQPRSPDNGWMEPVNVIRQDLRQLRDLVDLLNGKVSALTDLPTHHSDASPSGVTQAQFVVLKAAVENLEKRIPVAKDYDEAIKDILASLAQAKDEIKTLGNECTKNTADCKRLEDRKANKSDLDAIQAKLDALASKVSEIERSGVSKSSTPAAPVSPPASQPIAARQTKSTADGGDASKAIAEINRRLDDMQRLLGTADGKIRSLDNDKVDKSVVKALSDDLAALKKQLAALSEKSGQNVAAATDAADKAVVNEVQKQVGSLIEEQAKNFDWTKGQVLEIRATIEHIHHTKADTSLVANKAEREFVENSMEKLMREVELVLNATNAGLIDTLDKSLNILRDMIDGKATKADVNKLQTMIGEEQIGTVPEGLTGFKGYRCLGCNRTMDGMRQRPMGANFSTFMNRLPNGARQPNQPSSAQGSRVVGPSPPAGYIANAPQSH